MTIHVPIDDQEPAAQNIDVRTQGEKARDTLLANDPDHYKKAGSVGGKKSGNRPFKDPAKARAAVNARWAKKRNGNTQAS